MKKPRAALLRWWIGGVGLAALLACGLVAIAFERGWVGPLAARIAAAERVIEQAERFAQHAEANLGPDARRAMFRHGGCAYLPFLRQERIAIDNALRGRPRAKVCEALSPRLEAMLPREVAACAPAQPFGGLTPQHLSEAEAITESIARFAKDMAADGRDVPSSSLMISETIARRQAAERDYARAADRLSQAVAICLFAEELAIAHRLARTCLTEAAQAVVSRTEPPPSVACRSADEAWRSFDRHNPAAFRR